MTTRLKTIEYSMVTKATLTDNTLQAMTQRTIYIPEFSGTVTFKSVVVECSVKEGATMLTGSYVARRMDVSVGGATAQSINNLNLIAGSGENTTLFFSGNFTSHFVTNWTTGGSKTLDVSVLVDATASTTALVDVDVTIYITYEYDDTQTTQIKTVYIPLNAPVTTLATAKPGTAVDVIPALNTELPETSKTFRDMYIVAQGNINNTASTVDSNVQMQVDTYTQFTSETLEMGAISDYWTRFVWNMNSINGGGFMDTSVTHNFYIWGSVARFNHPQVYMVVTYEFDASASTDCFNSIMVPVEQSSVFGGSTSADFQRYYTTVWIEEPATITTKHIAFYANWGQDAALTGLNTRVGTGSFVTYTDGATVMCGGNGLMVRNDSAFTLVRGMNTLTADMYCTNATGQVFSASGFFIINYTSAKPTGGYGSANHTVRYSIERTLSNTASSGAKTAALTFSIPEANYFLNTYGGRICSIISGTSPYVGGQLLLEMTNGAGQWYPLYSSTFRSDPELGLHTHFFNGTNKLYRWANDTNTARIDPEATRRWWWLFGGTAQGTWDVDLWITYHTNTFTVAGSIAGSAGGTVNIAAYSPTLGKIASTSRVGNGAYSMTVYDNTETILTEAREDATHIGRSDNGNAA